MTGKFEFENFKPSSASQTNTKIDALEAEIKDIKADLKWMKDSILRLDLDRANREHREHGPRMHFAFKYGGKS
jgi:hypothetical protein